MIGNNAPCPNPIKQTLTNTSKMLLVNDRMRKAIPIPKSIIGMTKFLNVISIRTSNKLVIIHPTEVNEIKVPARDAPPQLFCYKYKDIFVELEYKANINTQLP